MKKLPRPHNMGNAMKTRIPQPVLVFLLIVVTFEFCDKKKTLDQLIIGKWDVTFERETYYENNVITSDDSWINSKGEFVLEIYTDGTGKFFEMNVVSSSFTWVKISEDKISITLNSVEPSEVEIKVDSKSLVWKNTIEGNIAGTYYKKIFYKECVRAD